jgi:hypothetical protein
MSSSSSSTYLGSSRVNQREHDANLLCQFPGVERTEAEGHQRSLCLAQEVSDLLRLTNLGYVELLQPFVSGGQILWLPIG